MNEMDLIQRAINGDEISFNKLVQPHIKQAHQTSFLLLHDYGLAEDAVQEALIQTYTSLKRYDSNMASFKTWFNRIVVNTTLKVLRKKRFIVFFQQRTAKIEETPETRYMLKEETRTMFEFIKQLKSNHIAVIVLHYFQELSIKEIAEILEISEGTVKSRLHKARAELKKHITSSESFSSLKGGDVLWKKN